jgi:hypothetical protein
LRAGPLSDPKVIKILNSSFVPVSAPNQDYVASNGKASPAERNERGRIYGTFLEKKLGANDVHIYVVTGDGQPVESMYVAAAVEQDKLYNFLVHIAQKLQVEPGPPAVPPHPQSAPPQPGQDSMVFHLVARGANHGSWREFPGENWIVLSPAEWNRLLPSTPPKVGDSWEPDSKVALKLLTNFYPQTEDTDDADRNRIAECSLRMKVVSAAPESLTVRLEGTLRMSRRFAPFKGEYLPLAADVLGFMEVSTGTPHIRRFNLTTWKAAYGAEEFGVALRYLPPEGLDLYRR